MDPLARRKTIRMIKEWGRAGRSVIVSSHILHEIESMTSNILLINNGRIVAVSELAGYHGNEVIEVRYLNAGQAMQKFGTAARGGPIILLTTTKQ